MKLFQRDAGERARAVPCPGLQLPDPPHPVKLVFAGGERMPARITRRDGDELVVHMLYPLGRPLREAERNSVVVEVLDDGQASRFGGCASLVGRETLHFSDLHFLQRREYVRVKANVPVRVRSEGERFEIECVSLDLSGSGMLLRGLRRFAAGDRVAFAFATQEGAPEIVGEATIVRIDADESSALCFEQISEADRRRLIRFLFDRQREERRKGLRLDR